MSENTEVLKSTSAAAASTVEVASPTKQLPEMEGKTALQLQAMGTKAYWLRKYNDSAAYLSRASEMFVEEQKDDKHNSLGNVYLYYGKALLELAREDGNPLGEAVPKEIEVEDEEDLSDEEDDGAEGDEKEGDKEAEIVEAEEKEEKKSDDVKVADISINGEAASSTTENDDAIMDSIMDTEDEDVAEEGTEDVGEGGSGNVFITTNINTFCYYFFIFMRGVNHLPILVDKYLQF